MKRTARVIMRRVGEEVDVLLRNGINIKALSPTVGVSCQPLILAVLLYNVKIKAQCQGSLSL